MKKSWAAGVSESVCLCVQAFPGIAPERLVRSGRGWYRSTRRNARTTLVPVAGRPAARGTWHVPPREGLPKIFEQPYRSHGGAPQIRNSQVTRVLHQHKIHWGCRFSGVPAARARGEEAVLTWGPPVKVNFVHVQCTCKCFAPVVLLAPLQARRYAPLMPNLQVTCMLPQHI